MKDDPKRCVSLIFYRQKFKESWTGVAILSIKSIGNNLQFFSNFLSHGYFVRNIEKNIKSLKLIIFSLKFIKCKFVFLIITRNKK